MISRWRFKETEGQTTFDDIADISDSVHYIFDKATFQPRKTLKCQKDINRKAMWFDGFSTYVKHKQAEFKIPVNALTVSVWVAPHAMVFFEDERLAEIVNQHDRKSEKGFILGFHEHGALSFQLGLSSGWAEVWGDNINLPKDKYSNVVASYDRSNGHLKLYLNGVKIGQKEVAFCEIIKKDADLLIGKNNDLFVVADTFARNMFAGLMDEVSLYNYFLTEKETINQYQH